jgi:hypothetical protein
MHEVVEPAGLDHAVGGTTAPLGAGAPRQCLPQRVAAASSGVFVLTATPQPTEHLRSMSMTRARWGA